MKFKKDVCYWCNGNIRVKVNCCAITNRVVIFKGLQLIFKEDGTLEADLFFF